MFFTCMVWTKNIASSNLFHLKLLLWKKNKNYIWETSLNFILSKKFPWVVAWHFVKCCHIVHVGTCAVPFSDKLLVIVVIIYWSLIKLIRPFSLDEDSVEPWLTANGRPLQLPQPCTEIAVGVIGGEVRPVKKLKKIINSKNITPHKIRVLQVYEHYNCAFNVLL